MGVFDLQKVRDWTAQLQLYWLILKLFMGQDKMGSKGPDISSDSCPSLNHATTFRPKDKFSKIPFYFPLKNILSPSYFHPLIYHISFLSLPPISLPFTSLTHTRAHTLLSHVSRSLSPLSLSPDSPISFSSNNIWIHKGCCSKFHFILFVLSIVHQTSNRTKNCSVL